MQSSSLKNDKLALITVNLPIKHKKKQILFVLNLLIKHSLLWFDVLMFNLDVNDYHKYTPYVVLFLGFFHITLNMSMMMFIKMSSMPIFKSFQFHKKKKKVKRGKSKLLWYYVLLHGRMTTKSSHMSVCLCMCVFMHMQCLSWRPTLISCCNYVITQRNVTSEGVIRVTAKLFASITKTHTSIHVGVCVTEREKEEDWR